MSRTDKTEIPSGMQVYMTNQAGTGWRKTWMDVADDIEITIYMG